MILILLYIPKMLLVCVCIKLKETTRLTIIDSAIDSVVCVSLSPLSCDR